MPTATSSTQPRDYTKHLSPIARRGIPDGIRGLFGLEQPGVISFLAGRPNPGAFPFESINLNIRAPLGSPEGTEGTTLTIEGDDLVQGLSYGATQGLRPLNDFCVDFVSKFHNRPKDDSWRLTIGAGCQDLLSKAFHTLITPGDHVLVEAPAYAGVLSILSLFDVTIHEVDIDAEGLSVESLRKTLNSWPEGVKKPGFIYTVPVGSNPTGCSTSVQRKLEILEVCIEHDVLVVEDDPYYFLSREFIPSYFALETELLGPQGGQVLRFDSFSKVLAGGLRLGFASGPKQILNAMDAYSAAVNLQPSSVSQAVVWALLKSWGFDGFVAHAKAVAAIYDDRRVWFEVICHKHLDGLASWTSPTSGMFIWADLSPLPDSSVFNIGRMYEHGVITVPGAAFYQPTRPTKSSHIRLSYSIIEPDAAEEGIKRLATALRAERKALGIDA